MRGRFLFSCIFLLLNFPANAQQAKFDTKQHQYNEYTGSSFDFVGIGDINGDGLNDLAGATTFYFDTVNDHKIFVWLQDANGQLQAPLKIPYHQPGGADCFAVSDLYKDSTAEVLIGIGNHFYIYGWVNNSLVAQDSFITDPSYSEEGVITADFDGDGYIDIGLIHWDGYRMTVIYQNGEGLTKWDMKHYNAGGRGFGQIAAGRFGSLQQPALIRVNSEIPGSVTVLTFTAMRTLQNKYDLLVPDYEAPHSAAVVKKGTTGNNELWVTYGGNRPHSRMGIWRGLQAAPDSTFPIYEVPEAIQTANLDCDEDDEPVVIHAGWSRVTVFTDNEDSYNIFTPNHYREDAIALGDINNDGRADICVAYNGFYVIGLTILYNITSPCWPVNVPQANAITKELVLYPNPASDRITVTCDVDGRLQVCNVQGRSIHNAAFTRKAGLDIGQWPVGVYFIKLYDDEGQILTKKLIKN